SLLEVTELAPHEAPHGAWSHSLARYSSKAGSCQAHDGKAGGLSHAPNLLIAAFANGDLEPGLSSGGPRDGGIPRPTLVRWVIMTDPSPRSGLRLTRVPPVVANER